MNIQMIIVSVIEAFFQAFAATMIIIKQSNIKDIKLKFLFLLLTWFYGIITFYFIPNQLRFIMFIIAITALCYFVLNIKDRIVILYAFNVEIFLAVSEIIISLLLVLFGFNSVDIVNNYNINLIANILISLLSILIINVKIVYNLNIKLLQLFSKNKKLLSYLYIFVLIIYLIVSKNGLEFILKSNYYLNILFILIIIIVITIIIKNESKSDQLLESNKQMLNYVSKYEKIITDQGKANHEFKNQLMVIRGYAQMNKPDKLIEYLDIVSNDLNKAHSSYLISQLNKFPDGGVKGLLYYKLALMEDYKIDYQINVENNVKLKLKNLDTNMYNNITKILGVLLDNAIDASKKCRDKKVIIDVTKEKTMVIFSISNTYSGKIDISKLGTGYTTKGTKHGYGLKLVKDIIKENSKLEIENDIQEKYYICRLNVKIPQKKKK